MKVLWSIKGQEKLYDLDLDAPLKIVCSYTILRLNTRAEIITWPDYSVQITV